MDNATRSERSRNAALQAALTIIARDGPGRLTLDAIARESGMSKGALTHQFRTKEAVLKALLEHQAAYFEAFSRRYLAEAGAAAPQPHLAAQIATMRETMTQPHSVVLAILAALVEDPGLLSFTREMDVKTIKFIEAESDDPELALLRWAAARGLALGAMFGLHTLSAKQRDRLFDRLLDDRQWTALAKAETPRPASPARARKTKAR